MTDVITLPWPPSNNTYYRHNRGRTHISEKGKAYRIKVWTAVHKARWTKLLSPNKMAFFDARLHVIINCHPPDKRRFDVDNWAKVCLDSLTKAGVWHDDSQIDHLEIVRCDVTKGGMLVVSIEVTP